MGQVTIQCTEQTKGTCEGTVIGGVIDEAVLIVLLDDDTALRLPLQGRKEASRGRSAKKILKGMIGARCSFLKRSDGTYLFDALVEDMGEVEAPVVAKGGARK